MRKNPVTLGAVALSPLATQEKEREKTHLLDSLAVLGRGAYGGRCYFRGMSNIHWASLVLSGKRIQAGDSGPIPVHAQSCLTLCAPMDCSPPVSSVYGISQARILEQVAIPFSRESSQPRD